MEDPRGGPYGRVPSKPAGKRVPLQIDWHDYLINLRRPGRAVSIGYRMRPIRALATGMQYRCTKAGVASRVPWGRIAWPVLELQTVEDGSVIWTAEEVDSGSLRTAITSSTWPSVAGLTLSGETNADMVYQIFADGGSAGREYEVRQQVVLGNSETMDGIIVLPVTD